MTVVRVANPRVLQRSRTVTLVILLALVASLLGCGERDSQDESIGQKPDEAQRASQAVTDLLSLARAGDWQTYVDRYYGESHKFRSDADRDKLVQRFADSWGEKVVTSLERVVHVTPEIEADRALFRDGDEVLFVLYRTPEGDWKFHL